MFPTDTQRVASHTSSSSGYPNPHQPPGPQPPGHHPQQQYRGDRKLAFGQLRQAVSSRLCDLLDEAGIHATRVVSGRRFVRWDTVPKLLAQQNAYISGLPYEFFFAKAATAVPGVSTTSSSTASMTTSTSTFNSNSVDNTSGAAGGSNSFHNANTPAPVIVGGTGYSLPPSHGNNEVEDVSMNSFDGNTRSFDGHPRSFDGSSGNLDGMAIPDTGPNFGSLPPLRFPSGAPAYHAHPHPHSSIQVDEGFTVHNTTHGNRSNPHAVPHESSDNTIPQNAPPNDNDGDITQTLIAQLHAQPLNINILSWKKQTIEHILDGLDKGRIRILARPQGRDVVFELELPAITTEGGVNIGTGTGERGGDSGTTGNSGAGIGALNTVDIPRWPETYPHSNAIQSYPQEQPHGTGVVSPNQSIGDSNAFSSGPSNGQSNQPQFSNSQSNNHSNNGQSNNGNGLCQGGPVRNPRPDRERRRRLSTNTNASTATGSAGSEATTSSWSGGGDGAQKHGSGHGYDAYGDQEVRSTPDGGKHEQFGNERMSEGQRHQKSGSGSEMGGPGGHAVVPLVHNHTLTPSPFRSHYQDYPQATTKQRYAQPQNDGQFGTLQSEGGSASQPLLAGVQHVSRPILSATNSSNVGSFLTTPTPTKKWTRRSSPDRIFMNVTLNGILRAAGMPIPRQKDDASRLPWSSIPQFLAENGLYIRGWPEANLPWLYSGDMGAKASAIGAANMGLGTGSSTSGTAGIGEWRDRIDWKSSPSQRSYKPLAQALRSSDIQILPRPIGRDVLFEVRDAQGRCYDSTLGLSDEWKQRYMRDSAVHFGSSPPPQASSSGTGEFKFVNLSSPGPGHGSNSQVQQQQQQQRSRVDVRDEDDPEEERGRPGYHSRSTSYPRSGSSRPRNAAMDFEIPSPTETTASTSSGATKRQGHHPFSGGYYSARTTPPGTSQDAPPRVGYQNFAYPSEHAKPSPLAYPYPGKASSFPPNQFHDIQSQLRRSTPPTTSYDRDGASSGTRFPQFLNRQYSESIVRLQRPGFPTAESSNSNSCRNTPSPDSSQRQRTVSLGTSSASTGTGTAMSGSSSGVPTLAPPSRSVRYNLPSLSHGTMDVDMDLDDPSHNRLPPLNLKSDEEGHMEDESRPLVFPSISPLPLKRGTSASASSGLLSLPPVSTSSSSLPTHLPSPLVAFSQPAWSAAERGWKLNVLDPARASLPPVGDTILWDVGRRSWKLTWVADTGSSMGGRSPTAVWSTEQDAWILDS